MRLPAVTPFVIATTTLAIVARITDSSTLTATTRPLNFLFIIVDDLRPALGCYGDARAHTPSIDRLARDSFVFDRAYAQQALCAPSRNSLLTSRRPDTLGLYDFYSYWRRAAGNYTTLPQHLKQRGYRTAAIGKVFHPGASCQHNDDMPYSWTDEPFHPSSDRYKDAPVCTSRSHSMPASNLICPVRVVKMPNSTLPDIEALQAAKDFLSGRNGDTEKPFFLAVGFQKPHIPLKYPKRYLKMHPLKKFSLPANYEWPRNTSSVAYNPWTDLRRRSDVQKLHLRCPWQKIPTKYARRIIQSYYAAVSYVDDLVGELLRELESLRLRDETVITLTSDHGWSLGEHAAWAKYSNFEVAVRVPLIVSMPSYKYKLLNGRDSLRRCDKRHINTAMNSVQQPVELLDVFPTIAELAGVPIPSCPRRGELQLCSEGSSLVPLIDATFKCEPVEWKNYSISQYPRPGTRPVCEPSSDEPVLRHIRVMGYTIRTVRHRYTAWVGFSHKTKKPRWKSVVAEELYDHDVDPDENSNVADDEDFYHVKTSLMNLLVRSLKD